MKIGDPCPEHPGETVDVFLRYSNGLIYLMGCTDDNKNHTGRYYATCKFCGSEDGMNEAFCVACGKFNP